MPYVNVNVANLSGYSQIVANLATTGLAVYDLAKAAQLGSSSEARFQQGLQTANLINSIAASTAILAPFAGLQALANFQVGLAHDYFAKQKAKREARRDVRGFIGRFTHEVERVGHNPVIAARIAAGARGIDPESVVPFGLPGSSSPYFSPRTRATDTPLGLLLDYGEGPEAEAARALRTRELEAEFSKRTFPGAGRVPMVFARLTRGY